MKILFVVKERMVYGTKAVCYGLVNSCEFIVHKLEELGYDAKLVQVPDYNSIDKVASYYKPTHCFIEAIWVTPSKLRELAKLHPHINWIIRIHSMIPFLVSEGFCFQWMNEYQQMQKEGIKISLSCNNKKLLKDLNSIYQGVSFTPNIYHPKPCSEDDDYKDLHHHEIINIGCFGALRVLKNHAQQAIWGMELANEKGKRLHFHINISEYELNQAGPVLKNLRDIFSNTHHKLVEHTWMSHSNFVKLIKRMDFGMQISFTETYNIIAADFVNNLIPVIVSGEIDFVDSCFIVNPSNPETVLEAMRFCLNKSQAERMAKANLACLRKSNEQATHEWVKLLNHFNK